MGRDLTEHLVTLRVSAETTTHIFKALVLKMSARSLPGWTYPMCFTHTSPLSPRVSSADFAIARGLLSSCGWGRSDNMCCWPQKFLQAPGTWVEWLSLVLATND